MSVLSLNGCQTLSHSEDGLSRDIASFEEHNASLALLEAVRSEDYQRISDILNNERRIDYNITDGANEFTPLMVAASRGDSKATKLILDSFSKFNVLNKITKKRMILNATSAHGQTPLILAAYHKNVLLYPWSEPKSEAIQTAERIRTLSMLMQQKQLDINVQSDHGQTALMIAVQSGDYRLPNVLLSSNQYHKIDVTISDFQGATALMFACDLGNKNLVELLLRHGADPTIKDNHGMNAFQWSNDPEIVQLLKDHIESQN